MYKYNCRICGIWFESIGTFAKYCPTCRRKVRNIQANNSYHRIKGNVENIKEIVFESSKKKTTKNQCTFDNCPFKSGNRPCLFCFEYKDGTTSCPGAKYVTKGG